MKQGIVMEIQANRAFVFTSDLSMVELPTSKDMFIGKAIPMPETAARESRRQRWLVPALAAACLLLLICTGLLLSLAILPQAGPVYLSLDINPSVELALDTGRRVTDAVPMNSEAWMLLNRIELEGLDFEEAIRRWVALVREEMPDQCEQVLISAVLTRRDRGFADRLMALDSAREGSRISEFSGLAVKVLYTMDSAVKESADANRLSYGRQMLFDQARNRQPDIDAEDIRNTPLKSLVALLLPQQGGSPTEPFGQTLASGTGSAAKPTQIPTEPIQVPTEPVKTPTEPAGTTIPAADTKVTTTAVKPLETTKATTKATAKATTKATTAATDGGFQLTAIANGVEGWKLQWTRSPDGRTLNYYKVVISRLDATPMYPDNGYLYALSRDSNSCWVNNTSAYHSGDFGGFLVPGQTYHVSVTYVFTDGKVQANTLQLTYQGPAKTVATTATTATAPEAFSPRVSASGTAAGITLNWDISPENRSLAYYKVVISQSDATPAYPDNGYLHAITSRNTTSCRIDNSTAYHGGDFGGSLMPGEKYYIAITYVFADGKVTTNVLQMIYSGPT